MKHSISLCIALLFFAILPTTAQIVALQPNTATSEDEVKIIFKASEGTAGLVGQQTVYMHAGVITDSPNGTDWQYVVGNWAQDDGVGKMSAVDGQDDTWEITLPSSIRSYFNVPSNSTIFRIGMVFRNADGTAEGKGTPGDFSGGSVSSNGDIFLDIQTDNQVFFNSPKGRGLFQRDGETITFDFTTNFTAQTLKLYLNNQFSIDTDTVLFSLDNSSQLTYQHNFTRTGSYYAVAEAINGGQSLFDTTWFDVQVVFPTQTAPVPAGMRPGVNYHSDPTLATLVLEAPDKEYVFVVGDYNNWLATDSSQMYRSLDGDMYWVEIEYLVPGQEYAYQFLIDGQINVADPYADKVLDPNHDAFIRSDVYPNLASYPSQANGIVSVLQTQQAEYPWTAPQVEGGKPEKERLVIYELLIRDFLSAQSYKSIEDSLNYFKSLGINTLELMPVTEFEGNSSWGYNPSFMFAPDKFYGSKSALKSLIDKAHQMGIAIVLDMVLNHQFGQSPLVQMYWDQSQNRPAANNPWFNVSPKHPFNVGYDMNHQSPYTQSFVDSVCHYWVAEYNIDGFRFDLSKGFTQQNNPNNVDGWSTYDQSRIDLLKRMADHIWSYAPDTYVILEHFAENSEEKALAEHGMLIWGNLHYDYEEAAKGNFNTNFDWVLSSSRGWSVDHAVTYSESHDEERQMLAALAGGRSEGGYDIQKFKIAIERQKLIAAFHLLLPGPKMLWQFQELGFDYSINACPPTWEETQDNCRVDPKPHILEAPYDYDENSARLSLSKTFGVLLKLKAGSPAFGERLAAKELGGQVRSFSYDHAALKVHVVGNFGLTTTNTNLEFLETGDWFEHFTGEKKSITSTNQTLELAPGQFQVWLNDSIIADDLNLVQPFSPIVITDPTAFTASDEIKIIFDASAADPAGTNGLVGAQKVYMHSGVILDGPSSNTWEHIVGNLGQNDGLGEMAKVAGEENKWELTITPSAYYGLSPEENVYRLAMFFRDANDSNRGTEANGADIYIKVENELPIVSVSPSVFGKDTPINIRFDARQADPAGTAGLVGSNKVYMHSGVIKDDATGTSWENVVGNWGADDGVGQMFKVSGETDVWEINLTPSSYYNLTSNDVIYRLGMVFRNADGSLEGKDDGGTDIFVQVSQDVTTGIADFQDLGILVYPNPSSSEIKVSLQSAASYRILDLQGALLSKGNLQKGVNPISVARMLPGLYLLELQLDQGVLVGRILVE